MTHQVSAPKFAYSLRTTEKEELEIHAQIKA